MGYEQVVIPEAMRGELARYGNSNVIILTESHDRLCSVSFMPPTENTEMLAIYSSLSRLTDDSPKSWFEFQKLLLAQQPVSIWQMPLLGKRQFSVKIELLALKRLVFFSASSVRLFEDKQVGVIICKEPSGTWVTLTDLKSGLSQIVLIGEAVKNLDELISALISDFHLNLSATDERSIDRAIRGAELKTIAVQAASSSEEDRLRIATEEIQRRRLIRNQPAHP